MVLDVVLVPRPVDAWTAMIITQECQAARCIELVKHPNINTSLSEKIIMHRLEPL